MAESYFKDPLLAKWEQTISDSTRNVLGRAKWREEPDAARALAALGSMAVQAWMKADAVSHEFGEDVDRDTDTLAALVRAELSGARRAREKAEQLTSHKYLLGAYPNGGLVKIGAESAAREILEAFDGE